MKRPVLAANWKMNNGPTAARAFAEQFAAEYKPSGGRTVILFPPAMLLMSGVGFGPSPLLTIHGPNAARQYGQAE